MGKKFEAAKKQVPEHPLSIEDAIPLLQKVKFAKFDETVELTARLGVVACGRSKGPAVQAAQLLGPPLLASMYPERGISARVERAEFPAKPAGPLVTAAGQVLTVARREAKAASR